MTTAYVVGFAFGTDGNVALIRKARPVWQKGQLNGVGGHIEEGESSHKAMVREFREETGVWVDAWELFAILGGEDWIVYFYKAFGVDLRALKTMTDEYVAAYPVNSLPAEVIPNLRWLIPLAMDHEPRTPISVTYQ